MVAGLQKCAVHPIVTVVIDLDPPIVAHEKKLVYVPSLKRIVLNPSAIAEIEVSHMMLVVNDYFLLISPSNRSVPHKQRLYDVHCTA